MKKMLLVACSLEGLTGLLLIVLPWVVVPLLFGSHIYGIAGVTSRVAGMALIGLSVAAWPSKDLRRAFYGMLTYSVLIMVYFVYVGIRGHDVGPLLWPAAGVHAIINVLLIVAWRGVRSYQNLIPAP